jgi:hypothetical protein
MVLELPLRAGLFCFDHIGQSLSVRRIKPNGPVDLFPVAKFGAPSELRKFDVFKTLFALWRTPATMQVALVSSGYTE